MHIILLCGYKRCGKDTFAKHVEAKHGYTHLKISKNLKEVLKVLFHFSDEQLEGDSKDVVDERWDITPREAMIFVGTDMFQYKIMELLPNVNRNFWIENVVSEIQKIRKEHTKIVISDLRFNHELERLASLSEQDENIKLSIVKIVNPNIQLYYDKVTYQSETEHLSFSFDKIIENNRLEQFHENIDLFLDDFST
jgi:ribonuclease BN (tRNA processing enzyme)